MGASKEEDRVVQEVNEDPAGVSGESEEQDDGHLLHRDPLQQEGVHPVHPRLKQLALLPLRAAEAQQQDGDGDGEPGHDGDDRGGARQRHLPSELCSLASSFCHSG